MNDMKTMFFQVCFEGSTARTSGSFRKEKAIKKNKVNPFQLLIDEKLYSTLCVTFFYLLSS